MKKLSFFISLFTLIFLSGAKAQNLIAVQNGGTPAFYTKLDSAVFHAQDSDTIYVPGGYYYLGSDLDISKRIHIIGVGHNPDSTVTTLQTRIKNVNVHLHAGASGGSLSGVYIDANLYIFDNICNYIVKRCKISSVFQYANIASNNIFIENILGAINLGDALSTGFFNNILEGKINGGGENTVFKNNIFLVSWSLFNGPTYNALFENNIFLVLVPVTDLTGNYIVFNNNLFYLNIAFPTIFNGCDFIGSNNIVNQPEGSIFINQSGNNFNYSHDYHLQPSCPGKNAGTDGSDIGIYGGSSPWKDGSIPANPHIQNKVITNTTDQNGNLNVNIKVAAQDH